MIRAIPSNASDNVYCTLLAQSTVHGAMSGFTGFTCGLVNGRHTFIPFNVSSSSCFFFFFYRTDDKLTQLISYYAYVVLISYFDTCVQRIIEKQNKVVITDRMWARLLSSTNQPSFLGSKEYTEVKNLERSQTGLLEEGATHEEEKDSSGN